MTAAWIIQTLIILCLGGIGYYLKDLKKGLAEFQEEMKQSNAALETRLEKRITCTEERYEALNKDLNDYKEQAYKHFTLKDDFIRAISGIDRKLDKITDLIMERRIDS